MSLALCVCKASETEGIVFYFRGLATQQMCKDNGKHSPNLGSNNLIVRRDNSQFSSLL